MTNHENAAVIERIKTKIAGGNFVATEQNVAAATVIPSLSRDRLNRRC